MQPTCSYWRGGWRRRIGLRCERPAAVRVVGCTAALLRCYAALRCSAHSARQADAAAHRASAVLVLLLRLLPCPWLSGLTDMKGARRVVQGMVLLGHSTGTQDTVRYMQRHYGDPQAPPVLGTILQAPVSGTHHWNPWPPPHWAGTYGCPGGAELLEAALLTGQRL